ncbi:MAG: FkbM family methyltransferase [Pseudomonadales bacterium]
MNDKTTNSRGFHTQTISLHSQEIEAASYSLENGKQFLIATPNGRTRVWGERFFEIEPELIEWIGRLEEDDILWDVGASIGHFSVFAAMDSNCEVYAFEPDAQNYSMVDLNRYLNRQELGGKLVCLPFGLSSEDGIATFSTSIYGAGEHTKHVSKPPENHNTDSYISTCLLHSPQTAVELGCIPPTAIKIDVDGSEWPVVESLDILWPAIRTCFIELPIDSEKEFKLFFKKHGLLPTESHEVKRMRGGIYDEIRNYVFSREL